MAPGRAILRVVCGATYACTLTRVHFHSVRFVLDHLPLSSPDRAVFSLCLKMIHLDWVWGGGSAGGFTYGTCRLLEQSSELNVAFFSAGVFAILPGAEIEHQTALRREL